MEIWVESNYYKSKFIKNIDLKLVFSNCLASLFWESASQINGNKVVYQSSLPNSGKNESFVHRVQPFCLVSSIELLEFAL